MTFEVEVGDRTFTVAVERTDQPGRLRITLEGRQRVIDVSRTGEFALSLLEMGTATFSGSKQAENVAVPLATTVSGSKQAENVAVPLPAENVAVPLARLSREFQIVPAGGAGVLLVGLRGRTIGVTVNGRRSAHAEGARDRPGQVAIAAPMPGRVVRVLVSAGQEVEARQPVVVVEAMKMENELRTPRAGLVREITVAAGTSVEAGRVLAVIE